MTPGRTDGTLDPITLVARDPDLARRRAEQVLGDDCTPTTRSIALRTLGAARRELGDPAGAERLLRQSAAVAARAGDPEHAAQARASRLGLLALRGSGGYAARTLARLSADTASARAMLLTHHGLAAAQHGRFDTAVAGFDAALDALDGDTDRSLLPGVLSNRGLALMYAGSLAESAADLEGALSRASDSGQTALRGVALQNLGCLAVRTGDPARAVACFGEAERLVPAQRLPLVRMDHADALLAAGMHREAARMLGGLGELGAASGRYGGGRATTEAATAGLLQAKVLLARGDTRAARGLARRLRRGFSDDSLWAELARLIEWSARHSAVPAQRSAPPRFTRPSTRRGPANGGAGPGPGAAPPNPRRDDTHRCPPPAGAGSGCADTAEAATALAHCVHSAPLGPVSAMLPSGPEAAALRVIAAGDHRSPRGRLVDPPGGHRPARHLELIVHARAHRREVAAAGARAALRAGDAPAALDWTEFASAPALPAGPCRNGPWLDLLDRCRALHARAHRGDAAARRELPALAETLSTAQWHADCMTAESGGAPSRHEPPAAAALSRNLAGRAFVRYVRVHGTDTAITVVDGRTRLHPLPSAPAVEDAVAKLSYAARTRVLSGDEETSAPDGVAAAARRVDRLLIGPVSETVGDRPLVIAPSPPVQALPWGLLPSLRGREVSVAPSGRAWLAGGGADADPPTGPGRVVLAAGGAPQGAAGEVGALASVYPGAAVLRGAEARVEQVLRAAAGAGVAHLAAHGSASAQTPMLAAVRMEDGPLFAYDIERLSRAPRVTVLSSCWVGGAMPASSGAPLGMAASLLAMGGRVVVAGVLPVSDRTVGSAMLGFHRALRAGTAPARAVADHLAGAGFVCYGTG